MPSRPHRNNVETVYQQTLKTDLYVVLEGRYIDEVTNVFITADQFREMYTANVISAETSNTTGEFLFVYSWDGEETGQAYIKAAPLIQMAVEALATKSNFPFVHPINIPDWETGLARYNKYFSKFGIKYINAKSHFVKAPAPKVKPCPKLAIYNVKKTIIDLGRHKITNVFGASVSFGAAGPEEVNGSACVIKHLGFDLKNVVTGSAIVVSLPNQYVKLAFENYDQFIKTVGTDQYELTEAQTNELVTAIADWWEELGPLKAE